MSGKNIKNLTVEEKKAIVERYSERASNKVTLRTLAEEYGVSHTAVANIIKSGDRWIKSTLPPTAKRMRTCKYPDIETACMDFIDVCRRYNRTVSAQAVQTFAKRLAQEKGVQFEASAGWFQRFKERHSLLCKSLYGESSSVDLSESKHTESAIPNMEVHTALLVCKQSLLWRL